MNIVTDVVLPIALAFIMFSLGLGLSLSDFTRIFTKPKEFFIGFLSQLIILPIVALILVSLWPLSPEIAIGVMILAAAPGGATSNILTSFAKGDVALSISLTAVISILSVITIPLILGISLSLLGTNLSNQGTSLLDIALSMFLIVTIPVLIGMFLIIRTKALSLDKIHHKKWLFVLIIGFFYYVSIHGAFIIMALRN